MFNFNEKNKKVFVVSLIVAGAIIGFSIYPHKTVSNENQIAAIPQINAVDDVGKNIDSQKNIVEGVIAPASKAYEQKNIDFTNELFEAKLVTGVEYYINENQKQNLPTLINFKFKDKNCVALGNVEPGSQKSNIRLDYGICDNEEFQMEGHFFDANRNFGSVSIFNADNQKYMVPPQDGFILVFKTTKLEQAHNNLSTLQLLNAELKTSTLMNNATDHIPALVSFVNNGVVCNSVADIISANNTSLIKIKNTRCGEQIYNDYRGWFIGSNKMANPNEEILEQETNQRTIPLQSGYVLLAK